MTQFEQVKHLMLERKLPVYKALKVLKINATPFYNFITEEQKTELRYIKMSFSQRGNYSNFKKGDL